MQITALRSVQNMGKQACTRTLCKRGKISLMSQCSLDYSSYFNCCMYLDIAN